MSSNMIGKITVKQVVGDKAHLRSVATEKATPIMRAAGIARGFEPGEGDNGPWIRFKGSFKAINVATGEEFISGKLFLPEVATDALVNMLSGEDVDSVEFGFDINLQKDDSSAVGYVYSVTPLIEPSQDNPMDRLMGSLPKLPANVK